MAICSNLQHEKYFIILCIDGLIKQNFLVRTGFCLGGPWGAFVGSPVGGAVAAYATEAIVNAFTPKHEAQIQTKFEETCSMGINKKYLHHFRRQPALWEEIDHMYFTIKGIQIKLLTLFAPSQSNVYKIAVFRVPLTRFCTNPADFIAI